MEKKSSKKKMGGPGDYPSDQALLKLAPAGRTRPPQTKTKRALNGSRKTSALIDEVQSMSVGAKRIFESTASNRLRVNSPKLKAIKSRIRILRWLQYACGLMGIGITCVSMVLSREHLLKPLPPAVSNSTITNATLAISGLPSSKEIMSTRDYLHLFRDFWDIFLVLLICLISNSLKNHYRKKDDLEEEISEDIGIVSAARFCPDLDSFYHDFHDRLGTHFG